MNNFFRNQTFRLLGVVSCIITFFCTNTAWAQLASDLATKTSATNQVEPAQSPLSGGPEGVGPIVLNSNVFNPQINDNIVTYLNYNSTNPAFNIHQVNLRTGQNVSLATAPTLQLQSPYTSQIVSSYGDNVAYFDTNSGELMVLNTTNNILTQLGSTNYPVIRIRSMSLKLFNNYLLVLCNQQGGLYLDVWNLNTNQSVRLPNVVSADIDEAEGKLVYITASNGTTTVYEANVSTPSSASTIAASSFITYQSVVYTSEGNIAWSAWTGTASKPSSQISLFNTFNNKKYDTTVSTTSNITSLVASEDFLVWRDGTYIKAIKTISATKTSGKTTVATTGTSGSVITEATKVPSSLKALSASIADDRIVYTANNVSPSFAATLNPTSTPPMPSEQLRVTDLSPSKYTVPLEITLGVNGGTGFGTVTAVSPASIQCSNDPSHLAIFCSGLFMKGETVTLNITPSTGSMLKIIIPTSLGKAVITVTKPITVTMGSSKVGLTVEFSGPTVNPVVAAAGWTDYFGSMAPDYAFSSTIVQNIITQMNSSIAKLTTAQLASIVPANLLSSSNLPNLLTPAQLTVISANPLTITNFFNITKVGVAQWEITAFNAMIGLGIAPTSTQINLMIASMKASVTFAEDASKALININVTVFNDVTKAMESALTQAIAFQASIYNLLKNPPTWLAPILAPLDPAAIKVLIDDSINQIEKGAKYFPSPNDLLLATNPITGPIMGPILLIPGVGAEIRGFVNDVASDLEQAANDFFCFGFC